tara:strand:- start:341 stop:529 length:189 start_codon:yes stop_codon:yes gene_type:complete
MSGIGSLVFLIYCFGGFLYVINKFIDGVGDDDDNSVVWIMGWLFGMLIWFFVPPFKNWIGFI